MSMTEVIVILLCGFCDCVMCLMECCMSMTEVIVILLCGFDDCLKWSLVCMVDVVHLACLASCVGQLFRLDCVAL